MFEAGLFRDRVAVVTGGGTGIGLAIARRLGGLGARIAIASRNHEHLERGCASLRESGIDALAVQLDVRNPEQRVVAIRCAYAAPKQIRQDVISLIGAPLLNIIEHRGGHYRLGIDQPSQGSC